jgi:hypothetical protein
LDGLIVERGATALSRHIDKSGDVLRPVEKLHWEDSLGAGREVEGSPRA